jgi:hypothetical protein
MLVHRCAGCGALSINRIAADDDTVKILDSLGQQSDPLAQLCHAEGIALLAAADLGQVEKALFGQQVTSFITA